MTAVNESEANQSSLTSAHGTLADEQPRVWTVYAFFLAACAAMLFNSLVALVATYVWRHGSSGLQDAEGLMAFAVEPSNLIVSLWVTALTLVACSLLAARLSPQPLVKRLSIELRAVPPVTLLVCMLGAPALGAALETLVLASGIEISGTLKIISDSVLSARGWEIPLLILAISIGPGLGEEFVFRGYIQTRLVKRDGPLVGILITATLFGLMHYDPLQSPLAGILGIYIGFIAYRFGSIWPAVLTHAFNNAFSITSLVMFPDDAGTDAPNYIIGGAGALIFAGCLSYLQAKKHSTEQQGEIPASKALP